MPTPEELVPKFKLERLLNQGAFGLTAAYTI